MFPKILFQSDPYPFLSCLSVQPSNHCDSIWRSIPDNHKEQQIKNSNRAWRHRRDSCSVVISHYDLPFLHEKEFLQKAPEGVGRRANTTSLIHFQANRFNLGLCLQQSYLNCWFRKFRKDRSWRRWCCIRRPRTSSGWARPPALLLHFLRPSLG